MKSVINKWTLIIIFLIFNTIGFSQQLQKLKYLDLKSQEEYKKGQVFLQNGEINKAKAVFRTFINEHLYLEEGMIQLAGIYFGCGQLDSTIYYLEMLKSVDVTPSNKAYYTLGKAYFANENFENAIINFEDYLKDPLNKLNSINEAKRLIENAKFSIIAKQNPKKFNPIKLPLEINSNNPESLPSISIDGKKIVFTRILGTQEDLYISNLNENGWSVALPIDEINSELFNEGGHCISADGKTIVFTGCNMPTGNGSCDLYISYFQGGSWTSPINLGADINTSGWESQPSLSANGKTLFFSAERPLGYGKRDIWVSQLLEKKWSKPTNIGAPINTTENEGSPFIHPDGETLYFMSNGLPGMGGYDLYFSRLNAKNHWTAPINLGWPINDIGDQGAMIVDCQGEKAYFTSTSEKKTFTSTNFVNTDIYSFDLSKELQPKKINFLKIISLNSIDSTPVKSKICINNLNDRSLSIDESEEDGNFLKIIHHGGRYSIQVSSTNFVLYSEKFQLPDTLQNAAPIEKKIFLTPISKAIGKSFMIQNIFFESGSFYFDSTSYFELDELAHFLELNKSIKIEIAGFTDDVGSDVSNLELSKKRAEEIRKYIINKGISQERIYSKGYGEAKLAHKEMNEDSRKLNRRTEFKILSIE